jgi:hypothetical protein
MCLISRVCGCAFGVVMYRCLDGCAVQAYMFGWDDLEVDVGGSHGSVYTCMLFCKHVIDIIDVEGCQPCYVLSFERITLSLSLESMINPVLSM